jgi:transcriptional regulator with XRE-family HTH domain
MATEAAEILASAGRALCGETEWQSPFARQLGINPNTVRRWLAGRGEPDPDVLRRAHGLLAARRKAIDKALAEIERAIGG